MQINRASLAFLNVILRFTFIWLYKKPAYMYHYLVMTSSAKVVIIYSDINSLLALNFLLLKNVNTQNIWGTDSQLDVITNNRNVISDPVCGTFSFSHNHSKICGCKTFTHTMKPCKYP